MKIREADVVSSSDSRMYLHASVPIVKIPIETTSMPREYSSTFHDIASECSRCEKNFATLRSLFVSRRWIAMYLPYVMIRSKIL
jgi:hypothetical protein